MKRWWSIKEISKLCNRTELTLQRWVGNGPKLSPRLSAKIEKALNNGKPARFSLNQVVQILQAVGKPMIADLIREIKKSQPKVESFNHFLDSKGLKNINIVAKEIDTGRKRLFEFLRKKDVFFLSGTTNLPYQRYIDSGYFRVKGILVKKDIGHIPYCQIFVTPKGEKWIAERWRKHKSNKGRSKK